mgnify:CR=1 FL=1
MSEILDPDFLGQPVKTRIAHLATLHDSIEDSPSCLSENESKFYNKLSLKLLESHGTFEDRESKELVTAIFKKIIENSEFKMLPKYTTFIDLFISNSNPSAHATMDYIHILEWILSFFDLVLSSPNHESFDENLIKLCDLYVATTESIELSYSGSSKKATHDQRLRIYVQKISVRCFSSSKINLIEKLEAASYFDKVFTKGPISGSVTLLGALTSTYLHKSNNNPGQDFANSPFVKKSCEFIGKQALLGKTIPTPEGFVTNLKEFFIAFMSKDLFVEFIVPNLEKMNLRSAESAFHLASRLYASDLLQFQFGEIITSSKLMPQTIGGLKNSKESTRAYAFQSLIALMKNPKFDHSSHEKIVDELFKNLKSNLNSEYKTLVAQITYEIPSESDAASHKVVTGLSSYIQKESNETVLATMLQAFFKHCNTLNAEEFKSFSTVIDKGITEKKLPIKKLWISSFLLSLSKSTSSAVFEYLLHASQLLPFVEDLLANTHKNDHSLILGAVKLLERVEFYDVFKSEEQKQNLGLNLVQVCLSQSLSAKQRLESISVLETLFCKNPELISTSTISGLEFVFMQDAQAAEEEYHILEKYVAPLFTSFSTPIENKDLSATIMIDLLYCTQKASKYLQKSMGWAGLVLKAQMDPKVLLAEKLEYLVSRFEKYSENLKVTESSLGDFVFSSMAYCSFINSEVLAPVIANKIYKNIESNLENLQNLSHEDIYIGKHGVDGVMTIDVIEALAMKKASQVSKNSKEYETMKWEESIRKKKAAAGTKTVSRKYTKEEQILVNEQLEKEQTIRAKVAQTFNSLNMTIKLVSALSFDAKQVDNGLSYWYPVAVDELLKLLKIEQYHALLGSLPLETFLSLSNALTDRLGSSKYFVGVAILRSYNVAQIPSNLEEEPLLELISRVLFRIKFLTDKIPFSSSNLTFILPLLTKVLEEGKKTAIKNSTKQTLKTEFVEEDKEEEHLMLAIEIILSHAEEFQNSNIPRQNILGVLLSLLSISSKAKMAKDCFNTLCQNISVSPTESDLKMILSSIMTPNQFVRTTVLETLDEEFDLQPHMKCPAEIFISLFDEEESNREYAQMIWETNSFKLEESVMSNLLQNFFQQEDSGLRLFIARAYANAAKLLGDMENGKSFYFYVQKLMDFYIELAKPLQDILDEYGLIAVYASQQKDPWESRSTAAIALAECVQYYEKETPAEEIANFVKFLVDTGALGDREPLVRQEIKEAGIAMLTYHGSSNVENLIPIFEHSLATEGDVTVKENVVVLYGSLAQHLSADDSRVGDIVCRLLDALTTPSEDVHQAVAQCISPLVHLFRARVSEFVSNLFVQLFDSAAPAHVRKGAAWGIAGLVKGYGISALSELDIIRNLIEASEDKKDAKKREAVAYSFNTLSKMLGKYFEPYVIQVLPYVLKNLGDASLEVRDATTEAAKTIMSNSTSFGVKKMIPVAIDNLEDIAWRTKRGSVELLGSMAYLDPTQLSASLSTIVPEIVGVLNDSHKEVRKAADQSLNRFGEVIRNPEIQKLVPVLIKAIGDPTKYTEEALNALIKTQFVHYIDGPSLALIIHVIHRGMRDRSANTKRIACKIVGNMAILVDAKDLIPYLDTLIAEVETAMVDPVPNTRATAARALGALVERLGEDQFPNLISKLIDTLGDETRAGDRLGAAQALSEVMSGLGLYKLDELLPTILAGVTSYRSFVREGFIPLLLFLPVCFGAQFAPYINQIIQPILAGLADNNDVIRDTSMKAGKLIVKNYANKAIDLLLPELEQGMFDENEKIRLSSVQLTADLLFQVTGISSKNEFAEKEQEEDEDDISAQHGEVSKQMVEVLGLERRDRILSSFFVCRSDTSGLVRSATVDVWKALVPNTPRTVKEILPTLTNIIVVHLASSSSTLRSIAAQTLGDLVRRVGANALSQLLPTLDESLESSTDSNSRQGVCIALHELIESSNVAVLIEFQEIIVSIIRKTLVDGDETVREAAAFAFDSFQTVIGKTAVDEVIPYLLNMLNSDDNSEYALLALQEIMATKSEIIFPILIPTLLAPPIDAFKARALGSLAEVAGSALFKRLSVIISALVDSLLITNTDSEDRNEIASALDKVFVSVKDEDGLHPLLQQILALTKHEDSLKRAVILERLPYFFENTSLNYNIYTQDFVTQLILSLDEKDEEIVKNAFVSLSALVKKQNKNTLESLVKPAKQALELTGKRGEDLFAFSLPKGPNCVLPIFLQGLMYGTSDERECSALAIADIVSKTPAANLRAYVTVITGPLIRVVGERFSSDIKAAILYALNVLFGKVPQFLRPFVPQLQRTFVKSLGDSTNETLRLRAAKALGTLIEYQPKVDPLVVELVTGAKQSTDFGVKTAMLKALMEVVSKTGNKLNETSKINIVQLVEDEILNVNNEKLAIAYARLIGALSEILKPEEAHKILTDKVLHAGSSGEVQNDVEPLKFGVLTLNAFLKDAPQHIFSMKEEFVPYMLELSENTLPYISDNILVAIGKFLLLENEVKSPYSKSTDPDSPFEVGTDNMQKLITKLCQCMLAPASNSLDSRRLSLIIIRTLARFKYDDCVKPYLDIIAPNCFSCVRDTIIPIKLAAEKAYLAIFNLVSDVDQNVFQAWLKAQEGKDISNSVGTSLMQRSIAEYTKRVATRLAKVERERIEAGGDEEAMFSDRFEDENEIWAIGGVDLNTDI